MNDDILKNRILYARELRWHRIRNIIEEKNVNAVATFSLNIPGYPKVTPLIKKAFILLYAEFKHLWKEIEFFEDDAGIFVIGIPSFSDDPYEIKKVFKEIEETHIAGRIMDIDVYTKEGVIKRDNNRKCFICGDDYMVCRWENRHTEEELREFVDGIIKKYIYKNKK